MVLKMTLFCSGQGRKWGKCQDDQICDSRNMTDSHLLDCQTKGPTLIRNITPLIEPEVEASSQMLPKNFMMINV